MTVLPLMGGEKPVEKQTRTKELSAVVGGHVRRPGEVRIDSGATLFAAVQNAGGPTEFGTVRRVKLIRDGKTTVYDLRDDGQKLISIQHGDIIEVPEKNLFGR